MFSSDVTARGMDYPDVTFVLQMGSTTKEQYTHRLGRTARAGKEGSGLLLCAPFEMSALQRDLRDMPLVVAEPPMLAGEVRVRVSHSQSYRHRYRQYICYSTDTITLHDTLTPPPLSPLFLTSPPLLTPHHPLLTLTSPQVSDARSRAGLFAQKQSEPHMLELAELAWGAWLGYYNSQQVRLTHTPCHTLTHVLSISSITGGRGWATTHTHSRVMP